MKYDKEKFIQVVKNSVSTKEVSEKLQIGREKCRQLIREWNIDISHFRYQNSFAKFSKTNFDQIKKAIAESRSIAKVLSKLGLVPSGGNYSTFKSFVKQHNLDISHFAGKKWAKGKKYNYKPRKATKDILQVLDYIPSSSNLKKRLIQEGLLKNKCSACGLQDFWNGKRLSLHLDHINGNKFDNRLENLRILCPNCHSQTKTYCAKKHK